MRDMFELLAEELGSMQNACTAIDLLHDLLKNEELSVDERQQVYEMHAALVMSPSYIALLN